MLAANKKSETLELPLISRDACQMQLYHSNACELKDNAILPCGHKQDCHPHMIGVLDDSSTTLPLLKLLTIGSLKL